MDLHLFAAVLWAASARNRTLRLSGAQGFAPTSPVQVVTPDVTVPPRVAPPGPSPALGSVRPLGSDEAVRLALALSPTLEAARADVLAARGRTVQARAGLLPTLGFSTGYSLVEPLGGGTVSNSGTGTGGTGTGGTGTGGTGMGGTGTGGADPFFPGLVGNGAGTLRTNLVLNQLLFDFNRTRDLVRQRAALARVAEGNLSVAALNLAQEARVRLANLAQNGRLVVVAESNARNRQEQLNLAQARLDAGLGPPSDVVRAKTSLADAAQALVSARNDEDTSRVLLAETLGIDPLTPLSPAEEVADPFAALDPATLVETGLARRPEIQASRENVRAAGLGVSVARKTNVPSVDLSLAAGTRGTSGLLTSPTATLGLTLTWNFADGGLTRGRTEEARAIEASARAGLVRAGQLVVSEIAQAFLAATNAADRVTLADVGVANAQEGVRLAEGRYRGGVGTFLEITDAQAALFASQRAVELARGDLARARANLRRATGEPVEIPRPPDGNSPTKGGS